MFPQPLSSQRPSFPQDPCKSLIQAQMHACPPFHKTGRILYAQFCTLPSFTHILETLLYQCFFILSSIPSSRWAFLFFLTYLSLALGSFSVLGNTNYCCVHQRTKVFAHKGQQTLEVNRKEWLVQGVCVLHFDSSSHNAFH